MPSHDKAVRQRGVLTDWNDERGFGFITPADGGHRAFVHVSAFPRGRRPVVDCEITFAEVRDERNRAQASAVQYVRRQSTRRRRSRRTPVALAVAASFFAVLVSLFVLRRLPVIVFAAYASLSLITFVMYRADKSAAQKSEWRTSEFSLHVFGLLGGWPGGLVARHVYRHKTTKEPFRTIFWATVMVNCAVVGWWIVVPPLMAP